MLLIHTYTPCVDYSPYQSHVFSNAGFVCFGGWLAAACTKNMYSAFGAWCNRDGPLSLGKHQTLVPSRHRTPQGRPEGSRLGFDRRRATAERPCLLVELHVIPSLNGPGPSRRTPYTCEKTLQTSPNAVLNLPPRPRPPPPPPPTRCALLVLAGRQFEPHDLGPEHVDHPVRARGVGYDRPVWRAYGAVSGRGGRRKRRRRRQRERPQQPFFLRLARPSGVPAVATAFFPSPAHPRESDNIRSTRSPPADERRVNGHREEGQPKGLPRARSSPPPRFLPVVQCCSPFAINRVFQSIGRGCCSRRQTLSTIGRRLELLFFRRRGNKLPMTTPVLVLRARAFVQNV